MNLDATDYMMNILSTAKYVQKGLDCDGVRFDVVVVDEAAELGGVFCYRQQLLYGGSNNFVCIGAADVDRWVDKVGAADARRMMKFTIAHEIGHLHQWEQQPPNATAGRVDLIVSMDNEVYADTFALQLIDITYDEYVDIYQKVLATASDHVIKSNPINALVYAGGGWIAQKFDRHIRNMKVADKLEKERLVNNKTFKSQIHNIANTVLEQYCNVKLVKSA